MKVLIVGDENLTFSLSYYDLYKDEDYEIEISLCLGEEDIASEILDRAHQLTLYQYHKNDQESEILTQSTDLVSGNDEHEDMSKKKNHKIVTSVKWGGPVKIHFNVNPCQITRKINENDFDQCIFVLPGLAYEGCPESIIQDSELFRLRLHFYLFSIIKSSRGLMDKSGSMESCNNGSEIHLVWPDLELSNVPFANIEPDKVAKFCGLLRVKSSDYSMPKEIYKGWDPLIATQTRNSGNATWLNFIKFYVFRFSNKVSNTEEKSMTRKATDDCNILKIPPEINNISFAALPELNNLFQFTLKTKLKFYNLVSKLSLKYDPRIYGWKNGDAGNAVSNSMPRDQFLVYPSMMPGQGNNGNLFNGIDNLNMSKYSKNNFNKNYTYHDRRLNYNAMRTSPNNMNNNIMSVPNMYMAPQTCYYVMQGYNPYNANVPYHVASHRMSRDEEKNAYSDSQRDSDLYAGNHVMSAGSMPSYYFNPLVSSVHTAKNYPVHANNTNRQHNAKVNVSPEEYYNGGYGAYMSNMYRWNR